jgi:hypothetical protein
MRPRRTNRDTQRGLGEDEEPSTAEPPPDDDAPTSIAMPPPSMPGRPSVSCPPPSQIPKAPRYEHRSPHRETLAVHLSDDAALDDEVSPSSRHPTARMSWAVDGTVVDQAELERFRCTVPRRVALAGDVASAPLDARDGFILSLVDGALPVHSLVDIAGIPEHEVRAILERLEQLGIIAL